MWTCRVCESSNPDWLEQCECCGAQRPIVDYVPKPMMVEKTPPPPPPPPRPKPKPTPKPPLEVIDEKKVDLKKHPHLWVTEDGKIGVPKVTKPAAKEEVRVEARETEKETEKETENTELETKKVVKKKKKRKKKRAKITDEDFGRAKGWYYLFSLLLALFVLVLMCMENIHILFWIIIALCLIMLFIAS